MGYKEERSEGGAGNSGGYKVIMSFCKEKVRMVKTQLELNPDTAVKDTINFRKFIRKKKSDKDNLHFLLDARGNIVTMAEEQAEILNAFFTSVCNNNHRSI